MDCAVVTLKYSSLDVHEDVLRLPLVLHDGGTAPATDHTASSKARENSADDWLRCIPASFNAVHLACQLRRPSFVLTY